LDFQAQIEVGKLYIRVIDREVDIIA
jgi:hypothetical protein